MESRKFLEELIKRNEGLKPLIFKEFDSMKELKRYKEKNKSAFNEYFDNQEKIKQLEWELKTPEERREDEETMKLMKLKREGKL